MNIPIKVVARIAPSSFRAENKTPSQTIAREQTNEEDENYLRCAGGRTFRFSSIFHEPISNQELYFESIAGLKESVLEGYDFSIVTYGARGTGKTFTLYGCMNDARAQADDGIVLWFVRDLFCRLKAHPERMFSISIAWSEITADGDVIDVLENAAMVQCFSAEDTYGLLGFGLQRRNEENHSILSLILEQQWTSVGGLNQHRQSTVSFCDLCGTDREMIEGNLVPIDNGLRKLEDIVFQRNEQYNDSVLTAFLKDSFGGRAQTLLLLCAVSSSTGESESTLRDLEFGERAEEIVNHVVMNTFSDNNVPIVSLNEEIVGTNANLDGLYFASQQWTKLLKNAESLFTKLFSTCELNQTERNQIEEWLYLKAECDDCFSSTDISIPTGTQPARACLGPIEEIDEVEDGNMLHVNGKEHAFQSDNESDSDICTHLTDVSDRIQSYIKTFQTKTNHLIVGKYQEFFQTHPPGAVVDSGEHESGERPIEGKGGTFHNPARRKSIFDSETVSSTELALMLPLKSESQPVVPTAVDKRLDTLNSNLRICQATIESLHAQIEEIRRTIALKQKYITDLIENSETRSVAKSRFSKKKHKLEAEYEKAKKQLRKAVVNGTDKEEINRLKSQTSHLEQRLKDLESIGFIAGESGHKKKKLQQSIKDSQKQLDVLQRMLKKELDRKETLERELEVFQKESRFVGSNSNALQELSESKSKIRNMNERISHIEHVLKEKSSNLKKYVTKKSSEKESLRCEIRNLRRTRDHLVEQRCQLDRKLREDKMPSFDEERKLVECDEAIEAIDAAIEMKNELICGRRSIDTDESLQREKGEQMLMARLNKLSPDEMRTLLYKYFQKVVDLKEASRKLELQFIALEREKDAWEWQEKILTNTIRQTRLEKERSIVALQKQHETKLNLMLRHFAADTSASISSTIPDNALPPYHTQTEFVLGSGSARYHHHHVQYDSDGGSSEPLLAGHTSKQLAHYKAGTGTVSAPGASGAIGQSGTSALTHHHGVTGAAPPMVPIVEKDHRPKSKLFSKLQVLSRYHGSDKRKIFQADIPQQNLKQLQGASRPSLTKVTREKNKIIIQSDSGSK